MSSVWGAPPAAPTYSDAPYGRSPSGRPYKFPPAGWVPPPPAAPPAPPRKQRSFLWLWLVAGGALLLVVVLVVALVFAGRANEAARIQALADATTMSMPERAGGLVRSTNPRFVADLPPLLANMRDAGGLPKAQGAVYGQTRTGEPLATAWGSTWKSPKPESALTKLLRRTRINGAAPVGVSAYPPGPLGGSLRCGELTKGAPGTLCAFADHGAVLLVFVQHLKPDKAAVLVVRMRGDIEHRKA